MSNTFSIAVNQKAKYTAMITFNVFNATLPASGPYGVEIGLYQGISMNNPLTYSNIIWKATIPTMQRMGNILVGAVEAPLAGYPVDYLQTPSGSALVYPVFMLFTPINFTITDRFGIETSQDYATQFLAINDGATLTTLAASAPYRYGIPLKIHNRTLTGSRVNATTINIRAPQIIVQNTSSTTVLLTTTQGPQITVAPRVSVTWTLNNGSTKFGSPVTVYCTPNSRVICRTPINGSTDCVGEGQTDIGPVRFGETINIAND